MVFDLNDPAVSAREARPLLNFLKACYLFE